MAGNTFSVRASFDGTELVQGFQDVKSELNGLKTAGDKAGKSLDQMLQQKNSTSNYSRQLGQIKQQLTDLAVNYSRLSDADKNSDFGVAMAARIDELTAKAQELKGVMDDVNSSLSGGSGGPKDYGEHWAEIQRQAEQTYAKFEGVQKVSAGVASGFAAIQGAAALLGDENEDLQKALLKVQSAMAIAQGIGGIKDLFEGLKQLKAAFTFTTAATIADTAAKGANTTATTAVTTATTAATTAQKAFNKAVLANPYVAIAAAVVAVGTALFAFSKNAEKARQEQEKLNKLMEEQKELNERTARSMGTVVGQYRILQREFSSLANVADKQEWIEANQTAFNNLGLAISSVNDADNIFINQSDDVIAALKARAKAEALKEKYQESFIAAEEKKMNINEFKVPVLFSASGKLPEVATEMGLNKSDFEYKWGGGQSGAGTYTPTSERAIAAFRKIYDKEREALENEIDETTNIWEAKLDEAEREAAAAEEKVNSYFRKKDKDQTTTTTTTTTTDTEEDIYGEKSLIAAQKEVSKLQDKLNRLDVDSPDFEPTKQALIAAEKKVEEIRQKMAAENPDVQESVDVLVQAYEDAEKEISELTKKYKIGILDEETAQKQIDKINAELQKLGLNPIEIKLKTSNDIQRGKTLEYRNQQSSKAQNISVEYEAGIITYGVAKKAIDEINADLEKLGLKPLELKIDDGSLAAFQERYESTMSVMDSSASIISSVGSAFGAVVSAINDENTALGSVVGTLDEGSKSWLEWGVNSVNTIAQVLPQIASIIMAQQAQALAGGIASGASLPFPANMAVIASVVAALLAMFASLPKFATGGIVNGSLIGDMNLARVNGGEMILNGRQQTNLFRMLDQNRISQFSGGSADVNFRIKGDALIGVIDNYNKKHGRG